MALDEEVCLRLCLDPFSHHPQLEVTGHRQDRLHDGRIVGVPRGILDKALVNLELVQRQPLEVRQAGIAGAKVIDGKPHAQLHQLRHAGDGVVQVLNQQAFGHLQDQQLGLGPGSGQHIADALHKVFLPKLPLAHIDRD